MATRDVDVQAQGRTASHRWPPLVRELAALDSSPDRVVTLYLDVCWSDEKQRERTRLEIKEQLRRLRGGLGEGEADRKVARDLDEIERFVEERTHAGTSSMPKGERGLARFLCGARGLDRIVHSTTRFPNLALAAPVPSLRPLLGSPFASASTLCAVSDTVTTRLYELSPEGNVEVATVEGEVPRRHHAGGWSQLKLQHYRNQQVAHHHRDAARLIERFLGEREAAHVLVAGRSGAVSDLVAQLGQPVVARLRHVPGISASDPEPAVLEAFVRALGRVVREEAMERVVAVEVAAGAGGRGCFGDEAVVAATNDGRVAELLLGDGFCATGTRCARCRAIGVGVASECRACGGPLQAIELGEALIHGAVLQDAAVEILVGPSRLDLHGGVAALLRF